MLKSAVLPASLMPLFIYFYLFPTYSLCKEWHKKVERERLLYVSTSYECLRVDSLNAKLLENIKIIKVSLSNYIINKRHLDCFC